VSRVKYEIVEVEEMFGLQDYRVYFEITTHARRIRNYVWVDAIDELDAYRKAGPRILEIIEQGKML